MESLTFQPLDHPLLKLRNRWVMAPLTTYSSYDDGTIHPEELSYLRRRAQSGYGMVMTAACFVHAHGKAFPGQWGCESDDRLPSLQSAADAIKGGGSEPVLQIHHGGRQCPPHLCGGESLSASAIPAERPNAVTPRAMTVAEIEETIEAFGQAARRAREAGFRGAEIHGANTYLLQQFVSPHSNRRDDEWGDPFKFPQAVVKRVLQEQRPDFWVGYRFSPEELETPGIRWPITRELVERLCGYPLQWLHVSLSKYDQASIVGDFQESTLTKLTSLIGGRIPLIGVGSVVDLVSAEGALRTGANLVALGRLAITDPECVAKMRDGVQPIREYPEAGACEALTIPEGLNRRILNAPGWFQVKQAEPSGT